MGVRSSVARASTYALHGVRHPSLGLLWHEHEAAVIDIVTDWLVELLDFGDEREAHGRCQLAEQSLDLARDLLCRIEGLD